MAIHNQIAPFMYPTKSLKDSLFAFIAAILLEVIPKMIVVAVKKKPSNVPHAVLVAESTAFTVSFTSETKW